VPGVTQAAYSDTLAFSSGEALTSFPLKRRDGSSIQVQAGVQKVGAGYFAAMGQRIVEGRGFIAEDQENAQPLVIVNREFSRKYLDGKALGWVLPGAGSPKKNAPPSPDRPIIGIVEDTVRRSVTDAPQPEVYYTPSRAAGSETWRHINDRDSYLVVRTSADPQDLVPILRDIVRTAAPTAPLESVMTMRERVADSLANPRLYAALLGAFALFGLLIAGVGLFGVLSYSVAQRSREIGVRAALGAQVRDIVGLVLRQSMAIALTGVAAGIVASFWISRTLQQFLYGVRPHDAVSFTAVAVLLLVVAGVATIVPARRAASVDPAKVLRS
jgi:putative ABC transport system permease protein